MKRTKPCHLAALLLGTTLLVGCGVSNPSQSASTSTQTDANHSENVAIGGNTTNPANSKNGNASSIEPSKRTQQSQTTTNGTRTGSSLNQKSSDGTANSDSGGSSSVGQGSSGNGPAGSTQSNDTSSPTAAKPSTPGTGWSGVELGISTDFGSKSIFTKRIPFDDGDAVMDALQNNVQVDTAYGGGFVNAIQGIKSGYSGGQSSKAKRDWFFWMNGSIAAVGANDYMLKQGDDIWWDFHSWDGSTGIPAVIGQYPHPFTTGYNGVSKQTVIYYGDGEESLANQVQSALQDQGAKHVDCKPYFDGAISSHAQNAILLGVNSDLLSHSDVSNLVNGGLKRGVYIRMASHSFTALQEDGTVSEQVGAGNGAILAIGSGSGDTAPVWVIAGVDQTGLQAAANTLIKKPNAIYHTISAIISANGVQNVPDNG